MNNILKTTISTRLAVKNDLNRIFKHPVGYQVMKSDDTGLSQQKIIDKNQGDTDQNTFTRDFINLIMIRDNP